MAGRESKLFERRRHRMSAAVQMCGLRHKVFFVNGDHYTGEWLGNRMHGKGTYVWKSSGDVYDGDWVTGVRCGHGVLSSVQNGSYSRQYVGQWLDDRRHGLGVQYYVGIGAYNGEWVADHRHGTGRMTYDDGSAYDGGWEDDQRSGPGMLEYSNGNVYRGGWRNDVKHGSGSYYFTRERLLLEATWTDGTPRHGILTRVTTTHTKG